MTKKILIGVALLAAVLVAGYFYFFSGSPLSPPGKAELTSGDLTISIPYSRPSVRGRVIFGTKENGALQPYGTYWRLGANASTEITFSRDVIVNGQPLPAGTYRMYAIPGPERFEIVLNSELGKSGSDEPNTSLDVIRTTVTTEKPGTPVEQFTIRPEAISSGINIIFEWENVRFVLPVTTEQTEQ